jgi:hypothetical protein
VAIVAILEYFLFFLDSPRKRPPSPLPFWPHSSNNQFPRKFGHYIIITIGIFARPNFRISVQISKGSVSAASKPHFASWKALDEIYKIHMLLHRSGFNISAKNRDSSNILLTFRKILILNNFSKFRNFDFAQFCQKIFGKMEIRNSHHAPPNIQIPREFENLGETGNLKF